MDVQLYVCLVLGWFFFFLFDRWYLLVFLLFNVFRLFSCWLYYYYVFVSVALVVLLLLLLRPPPPLLCWSSASSSSSSSSYTPLFLSLPSSFRFLVMFILLSYYMALRHTWLRTCFRYDTDSYFSGNYQPQDSNSVLQSRKAVCQGYSDLFLSICKSVNLYYCIRATLISSCPSASQSALLLC